MGQAIAITWTEHSAAALRAQAASADDGALACRLLAIAMVLEGCSRSEAARQCGMDRQTLRDWVHRYNAEGVGGLATRCRSGRPSQLTAAQLSELKDLVIEGPDPAVHGVVRWRCIDLCGVVAERFTVTVHERTIGKWLHKLDLTRLQPRPFHPKKDVAAQETFKKTFAAG